MPLPGCATLRRLKKKENAGDVQGRGVKLNAGKLSETHACEDKAAIVRAPRVTQSVLIYPMAPHAQVADPWRQVYAGAPCSTVLRV